MSNGRGERADRDVDAPGRRTIIAATLAIAAIALGIIGVWVRVETPSLGATSAGPSAFSSTSVVVEPIPGADSLLRAGDEVVAINGRTMVAWADDLFRTDAAPPNLQAGDAVEVTVRRDGGLVALRVVLEPYRLGPPVIAALGAFVFGTLLLGVAVFVFRRRSRDPAAVALLLASAGVFSSDLPFLLGLSPLDVVLRGPFWAYAGATFIAYMLLWAGGLHFALVFPRPAPALATRRWVIPAVYVGIYGLYFVLLVVARLVLPDGLSWIGATATAQFAIVLPVIALIAVAGRRAWRRGTTEERRIMRWFGLTAMVSLVATVLIGFLPELLFGRALVPWSVLILFGLPIPFALAAAVLRDRAFDIELVVDRSLVYGGLTLAIVGSYAILVTLLGSVLREQGGFAASLLSTGIVAILALPLRDTLQRAVSRLMYGDRDDPYRALARLGHRLESTIEPERIPTVIVDSIAEALRLPYVVLEVGPSGSAELAAVSGRPVPDPVEIPLVYGGEPVGRLLLGPRSGDQGFSKADQRLLDDLARGAGAAVHATRLTLDLLRSRERLVTAREEERRRLRRDLHDGLGPALAAMALRAETAGELLEADPTSARAHLDELRAEAHRALADIRRLVYELRPPALDELGLVGAIRQQAARQSSPRATLLDGHDVAGRPGLAVEVEAPADMPLLPAAVEVAAYRIAVEALTNAARHAGASRCSIRLATGPGLTIEIVDDGCGLPADLEPGVGITSMRERASELGGSVVIEPIPAGGTRVWAQLPLPGIGPA
jgi:two-component system NarL family sensor kinase